MSNTLTAKAEPALITKTGKTWTMSRLNSVGGVISSTHKTLKSAKEKAESLGYVFEVGNFQWKN
jgi:hypothetical protein